MKKRMDVFEINHGETPTSLAWLKPLRFIRPAHNTHRTCLPCIVPVWAGTQGKQTVELVDSQEIFLGGSLSWGRSSPRGRSKKIKKNLSLFLDFLPAPGSYAHGDSCFVSPGAKSSHRRFCRWFRKPTKQLVPFIPPIHTTIGAWIGAKPDGPSAIDKLSPLYRLLSASPSRKEPI